MSFILLGILNSQASGAAVSYWLATLGGAGTDQGTSIATDSAGNSYALGETTSTGEGYRDFLLAKYDSAGTVQWQRTLGGSDYDDADAVAVDSSDNVYVLGNTGSSGAGSRDFLLAKYNSSGTIQWQRTLGGSDNDFGFGIATDSSNNVYVFGYSGAGFTDALLAKYNSSGTIQWQRTLGGGNSERGWAVAVDSSDNLYIVGSTRSAGGPDDDLLIAKYNSSGTIQWQRILGGASSDEGKAITLDSSDNVYVSGKADSAGAGSADLLVAKYNSSGTIQWQRVLGGASSDQAAGIAIDNDSNVYCVGITESTGAGSADFLIAKYNLSGTIQFQRTLGSTGYEQAFSISVDSQGTLNVLGITTATGAGGTDFLQAKLPADGSLTGTYELDGVDMVYAASSLTAATSTLTAATSTLTAATSTLTAATSTLTDASASLTSHFVEIPA